MRGPARPFLDSKLMCWVALDVDQERTRAWSQARDEVRDATLTLGWKADVARPHRLAGTYLLCRFWLAHALALRGQPERADATLRRAAGHASGLGPLAEQVGPRSGELLGTFPQAFSHLGRVNTAAALAGARPSDTRG